MTTDATDGFVRVRGANENNLRNVDMDIPRNVMAALDRPDAAVQPRDVRRPTSCSPTGA